MIFGSPWFIAQAISSIRHGMGSRFAFEAARRGQRWFSLLRDAGDPPLRGFAVTVHAAPCLAIEDAVGCRARILTGQAWITAEGAPQDTIADAGTTVSLEQSVRFNVSAFRDVATVLVMAPRDLSSVDFALHDAMGCRCLPSRRAGTAFRRRYRAGLPPSRHSPDPLPWRKQKPSDDMDMNARSLLNAVPAAGVTQPDARLPPRVFRRRRGRTVVMLHSSLGSKSQWTVLAERLARRFRVIAIDLCGHGDNAGVDAGKPFTLDDEVQLITTHLDKLVPSHIRVHVVGHSWGGLVGLRFAQSRRGRIASLALYDPVVFRALRDDDTALAEVKGLAEKVAGLVTAGRRSDAAQAFVDFWSDQGSFASFPIPAQDSMARRVDVILANSRRRCAGR
jgi:hypothetical protein